MAQSVDLLDLGIPFFDLLDSGFPIFGAKDWLLEILGGQSAFVACRDKQSLEFHAVLTHYLRSGSRIPMLQAIEYVGAMSLTGECPVGRAAALLAMALAAADPDSSGKITPLETQRHLLDRAEGLLLEHRRASAVVADSDLDWPVWTLLHKLESTTQPAQTSVDDDGGCLLLIYSFPTDEIRDDTVVALQALDKNYLRHLGVKYPLIVFTDERTAPTLEETLGPYVSGPVVPAVIPSSELLRPMSSYSCIDGLNCVSGVEVQSAAHRGVINGSQFWSADYLRISRYTAGPLFLHPALDQCTAFLKIDTDFFFTGKMEADPIAELRREGAQLGYWQIHVQGQRQTGYMDAALGFLELRGLPIKNKAFYARGRFEEKAEKLGIPVSEVPEALEAATVVYGCLFGGDVRFFRAPLYQDFFHYMDAQGGFETHGWSNQFFLGTAAAAFAFPSQVRRLYISGKHQESDIRVGDGNVTEFLLGSSKSVLR